MCKSFVWINSGRSCGRFLELFGCKEVGLGDGFGMMPFIPVLEHLFNRLLTLGLLFDFDRLDGLPLEI
jgi:hypothetical protein